MQIEEITIEQIINKNIVIPDNQRGYDWKQMHADDFWNDMFEYEEEVKNEDYFLGTILVRTITKNMKTKYEILDGQQRLTTIFIFLIALREICKQYQYIRLEMWCRYMLEAKNFSFSPSPTIKKVYDRMKKFSWDGEFKRGVGFQNARVKPVYDFFTKEIKENIEQFRSEDKTVGTEGRNIATEDHLLMLTQKICHIKIALITINKIEEGFMLFERMNARGATLQPTDLLKNFLFSKQIPNLKGSWERITDNPDFIKKFSVVQMVRYFYMTREGHITKGKLYRALKEIVKPNPKKFVDELEVFANYYRTIVSIRHGAEHKSRSLLESFNIKLRDNADRFFSVFKSLSGLNRYGIQQPISVIFAYLAKFEELGLDQDEEYRIAVPFFLEHLERFHFINNFILSEPTNKVETHYGNFAQKFSQAKDKREFDSVEKQLFKKLEIGSKEEFIEEFTALNYIKDKGKLKELFYRIKLVDKKNGKCKTASSARRYTIDPSLKNDTWNLEHWLSQKPGNKKLLEKLDDENDIHNIGNILLISSELNNKHLQNKSMVEKAYLLKNNKIASELQDPDLFDFVEEYAEDHENWTSDVIKKRAKKLATDSYNIFWQFRYEAEMTTQQRSRSAYVSQEEIDQMSPSELLERSSFLEKKKKKNSTENEVLSRMKSKIERSNFN